MRHKPNTRKPSAAHLQFRFTTADYAQSAFSRDVVAFETQDAEPTAMELLLYPLYYAQGVPSAEVDNTYGRVFLELAMAKGAQLEPGTELTNMEAYASNAGVLMTSRFSLPSCGYRAQFLAKSARVRIVSVQAGATAALSFHLIASITPTTDDVSPGLGAETMLMDGSSGFIAIPKGAREMRARVADQFQRLTFSGPFFAALVMALDWYDWSAIPKAAYFVSPGFSGADPTPVLTNQIHLEFR